MNFDRLAPHYRWMEVVLAGQKMQQCRVAWLDEVRSKRNILLVGEGNGRFLTACAQAMPDAELTYVDASRAMLTQAERRWSKTAPNKQKVNFLHATLPEWTPPPGAFDLIATHFFLDCFQASELERIAANLAQAAAPGACWLISDFNEPAGGYRRWRAKMVLASAYAFFRVTTQLPATRLCPYEHLMTRQGFRLKRHLKADWDLLRSELWEKR
jgi:ubiquinone/menaquinone biosynthesis C-methylase UbiE